jgi:photosystem II stability/assembly factor-like uncharacterized protein
MTLDQMTDPASDYAYAAGASDYLWWSSDNGANWNKSNTEYEDAVFNDIIADPAVYERVFACGSGDVKAVISTNHGQNWSSIQYGLGSVSDINQLAKGGDIPWLYAATSSGIYKYNLNSLDPEWASRTNGIGAPNLGSIVVDNQDPLCLLVATASNVTPPHIWATGDSGRSWIELPLGEIPNDASINRLAASEDANGGFVAATNKGVFYLGDIFQNECIIIENDTIAISSYYNDQDE